MGVLAASPLARAGEECSAEYRKDVGLLRRHREDAVRLRDLIAGTPSAPANAKQKEENGFCKKVREAGTAYTALATDVLPQISATSESTSAR